VGTAGSPDPVTEVLFAGVGVEVAIDARAVSGVLVGNGVRAAKVAVSVFAGVGVGAGVGAGTEQPAATANNNKDANVTIRRFHMPIL